MTRCGPADTMHIPEAARAKALSWRVEEAFRDLGPAYFSDQYPGAIGHAPQLLHASAKAASLIDIDPGDLKDQGLTAILAGHRSVPGFKPLAQVYAGHQFGQWVPRLGDGRAILIAQVRNQKGDLWDVQIKGAGRTPYSRFGDGRAVLRSSIREYLASEAMAALGIPTTRALAVVATGEEVRREAIEPGAILTRLAPSHIRFGHFEYLYHSGMPDAVPALADHVIAIGWPELVGHPDRYSRWFHGLVERTAHLMAAWQAIGFCHGVMNTDNMSALGLTIDYGPFGFLDAHDPSHICSHSDYAGRYAFQTQPDIAFWNLQMLALCLTDIVPREVLRATLQDYAPAFADAFRQQMRAKLGLTETHPGDDTLVEALLTLMVNTGADHSLTFRGLSGLAATGDPSGWIADFHPAFQDEAAQWAGRYLNRLTAEPDPERARRMDSRNPKYVLRNWLAETAIRAVEDHGDLATLDRIFQAVTDPYAERPEDEAFARPPAQAMQGLAVSCSS